MTITPDVEPSTKDPELPPIPDGAVMVTLKIARFNPENPDTAGWQSFRVPSLPTDRLLNLLHYVKWYLDGTLTFRRSCAHGVCGSDAMRINGVNRLACKVLMRDLLPKNPGKTADDHHRADPRPARGEGPRGEHGAVLRRVPRGQAVPGRQRRTRRRANGFRARPTARATTTPPSASCARAAPPAARSTGVRVQYFGPAAIVNAHRFIFDSRDEAAAERLDILNEVDGVWRCRTTFNCTESCPRGIQVTQAIQEVKRALMFAR